MNATNTNGNGKLETLLHAVEYFADLNKAHDFFAKMRWPDGPICPRCGSVNVHYSAKYRRFECSSSHPRRQFTVKTGTIMEDSPLNLQKWAVAFWLEVNAKNSISSYEIHRSLGITQKSAWFMLHRIRLALKSGSFEKMGRNGTPVEADETFVGGKAKNMHADKKKIKVTGSGSIDKTAVMGLLERHSSKKHSTVRATVLHNHLKESDIHGVIFKHVEPGAHVMTDQHCAYPGIYTDFEHHFVNHAERYVDGIIHTNGLENFWSLFKRCIKGTHVSIEPFHLEAYLDSEAFRFNHRDLKDGGRFHLAVKGAAGKRLTYKALIGAMESAPSSDNNAGNAGLPN